MTLSRKLFLERWSGWILIWLFSLIPVILWASHNNVRDAFGSPSAMFASLGEVFGLVGFVLYAISLVLAIRKSWVESLFQGMNRVYIAHHIIGALSLVLLLFHPLFLALKTLEFRIASTYADAARFLWPRGVDTTTSFAEVQDALSINAGIIAIWGMVLLLIVTLFIKLPYSLWLFTHKFLGVAFIFSAIHIITISSDTSRVFVLKWYMIAWIVIGIAAYVYRTLAGNVFVRKTPYVITRIEKTPKLALIELQPLQKPITYSPGQFVFVRFVWADHEGIPDEIHPFSIASSPNEKELRLYIKALGDYTSNLTNLHEGVVAEVEGAFGRFTPARYGNRPQLWIAGGIGVTPFLSMARSLHTIPEEVTLVYSVATRSEMVEYEILQGFLQQHFKNFRFIPYITDEQEGKFMNAEYIQSTVGEMKHMEIFICGPPIMMKSMRSQLRKLDIPRSQIHTEEFSML